MAKQTGATLRIPTVGRIFDVLISKPGFHHIIRVRNLMPFAVFNELGVKQFSNNINSLHLVTRTLMGNRNLFKLPNVPIIGQCFYRTPDCREMKIR